MGELDPRIRIRAALRCDGIGRLDCAEDTVSGERLAVRWIPLEANGDAAVKACEKLPAHHALPRILQTGQVGTSAFVALDFPDGEMLSARGEERLDSELLLKLAAQLSDALAIVHSQGVVHGEMSRDSVLMAASGKASLWDMPLVIANRLSDRRGENRLMQNLHKTAPYLSPERARGEGASQEGDVYALGAILCVSAGAPLPTAPTTLGVVNLIASGQWVPRVPASLPDRWAQMLTRMVSTAAAARPSSLEVALAFAHVPGQNSMPTVPELQAVKLPPEIIAAADALMKRQLEAMRAPTREMLQVQVEAQLKLAQPALLPVASAPLPSLELKPATPLRVQANTLDEVNEPAPDVVRIPTLEIEALRAEGLVAATVAETKRVTPWVVMNDSLSISADLLAEGAMTVSAGEVAAIHANNRKVWMVFGSVVGAAIALIGVVVMLATQAPVQTAAQVAAVNQPQVAAAEQPQVTAPVVLDELTPLTRIPVRIAAKTVVRPLRAAPVETAPAQQTPAAVETAPVPAAEKSASADFNFLESAETPVSELKRPSTEM